jgi:hypothetical protein
MCNVFVQRDPRERDGAYRRADPLRAAVPVGPGEFDHRAVKRVQVGGHVHGQILPLGRRLPGTRNADGRRRTSGTGS